MHSGSITELMGWLSGITVGLKHVNIQRTFNYVNSRKMIAMKHSEIVAIFKCVDAKKMVEFTITWLYLDESRMLIALVHHSLGNHHLYLEIKNKANTPSGSYEIFEPLGQMKTCSQFFFNELHIQCKTGNSAVFCEFFIFPHFSMFHCFHNYIWNQLIFRHLKESKFLFSPFSRFFH